MHPVRGPLSSIDDAHIPGRDPVVSVHEVASCYPPMIFTRLIAKGSYRYVVTGVLPLSAPPNTKSFDPSRVEGFCEEKAILTETSHLYERPSLGFLQSFGGDLAPA